MVLSSQIGKVANISWLTSSWVQYYLGHVREWQGQHNEEELTNFNTWKYKLPKCVLSSIPESQEQ